MKTINAKDLGVLVAHFLLQFSKRRQRTIQTYTLLSSTIMDGKEFRKTKEALFAKQKELKKEGKGNKPNAARMLTNEEVGILFY